MGSLGTAHCCSHGREGREQQKTGQGGGRSTRAGHRLGSRSSSSVSGGTCRCAVERGRGGFTEIQHWQ